MIKTEIMTGGKWLEVEFYYFYDEDDDSIEITGVLYYGNEILSTLSKYNLDLLTEIARSYHNEDLEAHQAMSDDLRVGN